MNDATNDNTTQVTVEEQSPRIKVINFAVELPPSALQGMDEPAPQMPTPADNVGVVGTITLLNKSAMIWFGWGQVTPARDESSITARGVPTMGQVVMGMPRTKYSGAFSDSHESSCSQLVGGQENDCLNAMAMASRMSQKVGYPIIVSGGLSTETEMMESLLSGVDHATAAQRAAALTEREVARILQEEKVSQTE